MKYWEFDPFGEEGRDRQDDKTVRRQSSDSSSTTRVDPESPPPKPKRKWGFRRSKKDEKAAERDAAEREKEPLKPVKRMPVIFFDEAHKL